ncbi:MAG: phosphate/phosphite/phosphonate ABC transporter substrate-binding protein [Proteobacteria bacterium]|nr:phosphate/phosphite/phosphonate ABC transporter substrate-binding protein [Pseudomonadota bacterium]
MRREFAFFVTALLLVSAFTACTGRKGEIGSEANPVRLYFMPLKGEEAFKAGAEAIEKFVEGRTGLAVEAVHANDFITIIKALGQRKADAAFMNTLGYVLAHDWTKAEAHLKYLYGDVYSSYRGEILAQVGSGIETVADLQGKRVAFADPYSAGGYIYPMKLLKEHSVTPGRIVFAKGHKNAVQMLYDGEVDAAATFHSQPSAGGLMRDARTEIAEDHPDVISKLKIIALTDEIPNGPIATRYDIPDGVKQKLVSALSDFSRTPEGRKTLFDLYNMTGLVQTSDSDYDGVRAALKELNKTVQEVVPGGISFYRTYIVPGLE